MFSMKYKKIYDEIIKNRLANPILNDYTECHHIIPKSLGGSNDKSNLVNLLAREHFICHLLLTKMYEEGSSDWVKMVKAFMRMYSFNSYQKRYSNNKWYEYLKKSFSKAQSLNQTGKINSSYGTVWISNIELKQCLKINKKELKTYLDNGWIKKRVIKWDSYDIDNGKISNYLQPTRKETYYKTKDKVRNNIEKYNYYWSIYKNHSFSEFVKITGYDKTLENLIGSFHRYVEDYVPQQRKRYKKI